MLQNDSVVNNFAIKQVRLHMQAPTNLNTPTRRPLKLPFHYPLNFPKCQNNRINRQSVRTVETNINIGKSDALIGI